jgi:pectate lyase
MNIIRQRLSRAVGVLAILASIPAYAVSINDTPLGWASQNGGTTGGSGGTVVVASTLSQLQTYAKATGKYIIYVSGTMGTDVTGTTDASKITRVVVTSNKTIFGLPGATLVGGFDIKSASNVIIRNMKVQGPGSVDVDGVDDVWIDKSTNVWIDHMDIADGQDGNLDITNGSSYVTVSYTKFTYTSKSKNHQFCNLIGNSDSKTTDNGKLKTTMMYNWWADGVQERMPRVRWGQVHVVNNLFTSTNGSYSVRAGYKADILVEANAFVGVKNPIDLFEGDYTAVTAKNNLFSGTSGTTAGKGTAFTPPYTLNVIAASAVAGVVKGALGAGATLCDVRSSTCGTATVSSSSAASSSSVAVSSSSAAVSSSSSAVASSSSTATTTSKCIAFVNGVGGYGSNCYKSGLTGMASGVCYTMNADRGTAPSWINGNATDTWWWTPVSCSTGLPKALALEASLHAVAQYRVYDPQGRPQSVSAQFPQNLPTGSWFVVGEDERGQMLSRQVVTQP